ncbi:MAG: ribonuclease HII [Melioribacteraceae bacterium]|nr:ribonuclease HII [Melioribacteraceae bacterium]
MKEFDLNFFSNSVKTICGVDEAGRGPLAGPVVAAAVIFDKETIINGINDSKKINAVKREELYHKIIDNAESFGVGIVDQTKIDEINILNASLLAMKLAVEKLSIKPDLVLIDGNKSFNSEFETKTIVRGDAKSFSIAAASIIAKVTRDKIMLKESENFPHYSWQTNKGYPTKAHIQAIKKFGFCKLHRKTFLTKILSREIQLSLDGKS